LAASTASAARSCASPRRFVSDFVLFRRIGVILRMASPLNRDSSGLGEPGATGIFEGVFSHVPDVRGMRDCETTGAVLPH
jgi:hypothetical protein